LGQNHWKIKIISHLSGAIQQVPCLLNSPIHLLVVVVAAAVTAS
jgi:hypothetical protein